MSVALLALAILLALLIGANLIRVALGPTFYDRLLGVGVIGTNAVLLLVVIGFIFDRPDGFMDLAITYALLNFIGVVGVAKFLDLERGGEAWGGGPGRRGRTTGGAAGDGSRAGREGATGEGPR